MKPQLLLTFAGGLLLGWLGSVTWRDKAPDGPTARHAPSCPEPGPGKRFYSVPADTSTAVRLRGEKDRGALSPLHATRLAQALRQPAAEPQPDISTTSAGDQRFSRWLEQSDLTEDLRAEIAAYFAKEQQTGGTVDPLRAGSPFDQWLRGQLDENSSAAWNTLLDEHRGDVVERRANHLLVGLQEAVALSNEQKDAIYPKLAEWVRGELEQPIPQSQTGADAREEWLASRHGELSAILPSEQHDAIAEWLTEFLPAYWLAEDIAR